MIRRNLQGGVFAEFEFAGLARKSSGCGSLARMHLRDIGRRIDQLLSDKKVQLDDTSRPSRREQGADCENIECPGSNRFAVILLCPKDVEYSSRGERGA